MPDEAEKGGIQPETLHFLRVDFATAERNGKEGSRSKSGTYRVIQQYPYPK